MNIKSFDARSSLNMLKIVIRRFWVIILCVLLAGINALVVFLYLPLTYESSLNLMVELAQNTRTSEYDTLAAAERMAFTYSQMIKNADVMKATIDKLGLSISPESLLKKISAEPIKDSHLIRVSAVDASPKAASSLVNALAEVFIQYNQTIQTQRYTGLLADDKEKLENLDGLIEKAQSQINLLTIKGTEDQTKLNNLKENLIEYKSDYRLLLKQQEDLHLKLQQLDNHVTIAEPAQPAQSGSPFSLSTATATMLINPDPVIEGDDYSSILAGENLATTYVQVVNSRPIIEAARLKMGLQEKYEDLVKYIEVETVPGTLLIKVMVRGRDPSQAAALANTIAAEFISQNLSSYQKNYTEQQADIENQMKIKSATIGHTEASVSYLTLSIKQAGSEVARLGNLVSKYHNDRVALEQNDERIRGEMSQSADSLLIVEPARVPNKPVQNRALMVFLAGLFGIMEGAALALVMRYFDNKMRTPVNVSSVFGSIFVGVIGRREADEPELFVGSQPPALLEEQFHVLATRIRRNLDPESPHNLLLVTSSTPSEGKSFVSANIAIAMAATGMRVVLVDADLRKPHLHQLFKLEPSKGIAEVLEKDFSDIELRSTGIGELKLLPGGTVVEHPDRVLNSLLLEQLFASLKQASDLVIVDCPPLLALADTHILAAQSDGVIFVVRSGQTSHRAVQEAKIILEQIGARLISVVLNDIPYRAADQYYYYDYIHKSEKRSFQLPF